MPFGAAQRRCPLADHVTDLANAVGALPGACGMAHEERGKRFDELGTRGAGGCITDWQGNDPIGGSGAVATAGIIHDAVIRSLNP